MGLLEIQSERGLTKAVQATSLRSAPDLARQLNHRVHFGFRVTPFAEYVCITESAPMVKKPASMSFEQAAALPQATHIALQAIRDKAKVQPDQSVLINGAGGGAGTLAVQLAKMYGAKVTGVDGPTKLEMLKSIGADLVSLPLGGGLLLHPSVHNCHL